MAGYSQIKSDLQIQEILDHHLPTYRYCGETGQEYNVIQSVFLQLNNLKNINNSHIRWYAVIVHLERRFQNQHLTWSIPAPSCIDELEIFIEHIAQLGILIASKLKVNSEFVDLKLENINQALIKLIEFPVTGNDLHPDHDVFRLTIDHASHNAKKLEEYCGSEVATRLNRTITSEKFQTSIHLPSKRIPAEHCRHLFNMDDFWNGFIP